MKLPFAMLCVYFVWAFTCVSTNGFLGETPFGALRNQNRGSPAGRARISAQRRNLNFNPSHFSGLKFKL
jgi:hypothetical protein